MLKNFFMKAMLKSQLKNVPEAQRDMLIAMVEKNPDLFEKIAQEIQEKIKNGRGQQEASIEVMTKYKSELQQIMQK
jgi:hypothetical protein